MKRASQKLEPAFLISRHLFAIKHHDRRRHRETTLYGDDDDNDDEQKGKFKDVNRACVRTHGNCAPSQQHIDIQPRNVLNDSDPIVVVVVRSEYILPDGVGEAGGRRTQAWTAERGSCVQVVGGVSCAKSDVKSQLLSPTTTTDLKFAHSITTCYLSSMGNVGWTNMSYQPNYIRCLF